MNKRWFIGIVVFLCCIILILSGMIFYKESEKTNAVSVRPAKNESQIYRNRTVEIPTPDTEEKTPERPPQVKISYEASVEEAKHLAEHGYFSQSTMLLGDLIREKPDKLKGYLALAEIYLRKNDISKLTKLLEAIEPRFPEDENISLLRARKWIAEEKFELVLSMTEKLEDPSTGLKWYQMVLYSLQNNHKKAKSLLEDLESQEIDDRSLEAKVIAWGSVYSEFNDISDGENAHLFALFAKSLAEYDEPLLAKHFADLAIKDEIGYIDAWVLRGYSYLLMQQYPSAIADLRHAYSLDPTRPQIQYFLGLALYESEQFSEAVLYFEQVLEYDFEFSESVRWKLVEIFSDQKKYEQALEMYESLLESEEDPHRFVSAIDMAVNILGKPDVALQFTERLMQRDPENIFLNNLYAWALIANKQYFDAEQILNKVLKEDAYYARTHLNLGLLYEEQKKFTEAREYYKKAYLYGKTDPKLLSIVNLASERYNRLLDIEDRPEVEEVLTDRKKNSP